MEKVDLRAQFQSRLEDNAILRQLGLALLALAVGAAAGLVMLAGNPLALFGALTGLLVLPLLVTRPMADMFLIIGTVTLLPFAVLPVRLAVFTPTLLEIGLLLLFTAWLLRLLLNPAGGLARTPIDVWVVLFMGCTLFAFVLGLGRDASSDVIHNYIKLLLAVSLFFAAAGVVRTSKQVEQVLRAAIVVGAIEALIGLVLWRLPDALASGLLTRLSVVGYPTDRVLRYIEDNPALGERAVGTQVDPNSFGGMLVIIAVLTGVQLLARKPLLPRWLLGGMFLVDAAALVLTGSRSALIGLLAASAFVATLRYRRLWGWGLAGAVAILVLGLGSGYFARLANGLRFQDQASLMRLAEYSNAFRIIGRYPAFGVGFGTAGELDLTTGVSSVYLTVAERAGLLGLGLFLLVALFYFTSALPSIIASGRRAPPAGSEGEEQWSALDSGLMGCTAALLAALVVGTVDHYYFNPEFPHMVALFWLIMALGLVSRDLLRSLSSTHALGLYQNHP